MSDLDDILRKIDEGAAKGDSTMVAVRGRYLSQENETGPFLLFLMGDTIEQIADKTKTPKEVLAVTARQHNWLARKEAFAASGRNVPGEIQKGLVNMILATTYLAVKDELAMVMKGERDPSQTKFVPKNIAALQTLIEMVNTVNAADDGKQRTKAPSISGDKVQVNIYGDGTVEAKPQPTTKADVLRRLADAAEEPRKRGE